jgi:putative transposase
MVGRKRVRRLMAKMGLAPIYQRPRTTVPHPGHRVSEAGAASSNAQR